MDREIIISLSADRIEFNHKDYVGYGQTNLPKKAFSFDKEAVFWKVYMTGFDKATGTLSCKVLDYDVNKPAAMYLQDQKSPIKKLVFEQLDWNEFSPLLSHYNIDQLRPVLFHAPPINYMEKAKSPATLQKTLPPVVQPVVTQAPAQPVARPFDLKLKVYFEDLTFSDGKVSFEIEPEAKPFTVEFDYGFLQESFNFCKEWFAKKFKKQYLNIHVTGVVISGRLATYEVISNDLLSINETMIAEIREFVLTDYLKRASKEETGSRVRGMKHIVEDSGIKNLDTKESSLSQQEIEILISVIMARSARNEKQLAFLSKHSTVMMNQLKFTRPPKKGLIFAFQGNMFTHFVWELLNSNATYIWSFPTASHSSSQMHEFLETYIALISEDGRMHWRRHIDTQLQEGHLFKAVDHRHQNTHLNEGLPEWIDSIETIIKI